MSGHHHQISEKPKTIHISEPWLVEWKPDQAHEMQATSALLCPFACLHNHCVLVKLPLLNRHVYADNVLPYHSPSADVQMPANFREQLCRAQHAPRSTYPTSEFPISPSLNPTAVPDALSVLNECFWAMASMLGVSAASMALPSKPCVAAIPQPSCTLHRAVRHQSSVEETLTLDRLYFSTEPT